MAKFYAILFALQVVWGMGFHRIIVGCDFIVSVMLINQGCYQLHTNTIWFT